MFDPYHKWLGIPPDRQPATYYQLLGIQPEERDLDVIEESAIRQSVHLRTYQLGPHAALCTKLLNEIAEAKAVLLNPARRAAYDAKLARSTPPLATVAASQHVSPLPTGRSAAELDEDDEEFDDDFRPKKRKRKGKRGIARGGNGLPIKLAIGAGAAVLVLVVATVGLMAMRDRPANPPARQVALPNPVAKGGPAMPGKADGPAVKPKDIVVAKVFPVPAPKGGRFIDHGDWIEDTQTRLWWQKEGQAGGKMHFYDAAKYATTVKLNDKFGWRVPTRDELKGIFPAADPPFQNTSFPGSYWTSDFDVRLSDNAWLYNWQEGKGPNNCIASRNFGNVRLVREPVDVFPTELPDRDKIAAQVKDGFPKDRFIDRGDHIEDTKTGLLWQKDGAASGNLNFYDAMKYAATIKLADTFGWRVPTILELATIFPADQAPFQNTKYNPNKFGGGGEFVSYWTSNLERNSSDSAFIYQWYETGGANNCFASLNPGRVRCVHDPLKK